MAYTEDDLKRMKRDLNIDDTELQEAELFKLIELFPKDKEKYPLDDYDLYWLKSKNFVLDYITNNANLGYSINTNYGGDLYMELCCDTREIEGKLIIGDFPAYKKSYGILKDAAERICKELSEEYSKEKLDYIRMTIDISEKRSQDRLQDLVDNNIEVSRPFRMTVSNKNNEEFSYYSEYRLELKTKSAKPVQRIFVGLAKAIKDIKEPANSRLYGHDFLGSILYYSGVEFIPNDVDIEEGIYDACMIYMEKHGDVVCNRPIEEQLSIYIGDDGKKHLGRYFDFWFVRGLGGSYVFKDGGSCIGDEFKEVDERRRRNRTC
jgi:hypothetical protein